MPLLDPLDDDQRTTFMVVSLPRKELLRLAGQLGTVGKGQRIDKLGEWDLAWSLTDYYGEGDVAEAVDRALEHELGTSPLTPAVVPEGAGDALSNLVWKSRDPARDLAWALLGSPAPSAGPVAAQLVQRIIAEFDAADERAKTEEEARAAEAARPAEPDPAREAAEREHKIERDRQARDRERKRLEDTKGRLSEVEQALAAVRRDLRVAEEARERGDLERRRVADERDSLRAELKQGTAGEVVRLREELETLTRQVRAAQRDADEAREAEAALGVRVRQLESAPTLASPGAADDDAGARPDGSGPGWCVPVFADEFYESIRRWDRKIVRNAFEKVYRLAEDWRHPSLRAIPLEGLPGCFRIRIATDVRLIYRPLDGNRLEIMALIDREDLQRYIRQAKTR